MENETKFAFKVIENKERVSKVVTPVRISPSNSNPMLAKFLEFRQAKKLAPKDLV